MKFRRKLLLLLVYSITLLHLCSSATNYLPYIDPNTNIIIKVLEDTAVGTSLRNITAIDLNNDNVTFSLDATGNTILKIRKIGVREGELTLRTPLNRELTSSYSFNVRVTDDENNKDRMVPKLFILNVLDVNDNKPVFTKQPYRTSIPENTTVNTTLMTIQATDADLAANAVVEYRFSNDSSLAAQTAKFSIDNLHGTITLTSPLDYETTSRYLLPVIAEDGGNPKLQSETTVVIDVTDISDMPPKFEQSIYLKEIYENTPVGTTVQKVVARDGDTGVNNPMKYEIYSGNDGSFVIDSSTGIITTNNTIDAEKTLSYKLYIRASEVPDPSSNATVTVLFTVIDKNDNPPVFSKNLYTFALREDLAKPGRIVTDQLIVTDADKNPEFRRHTYQVTGGNSDKFSIDPSSGVLKINSTLDYETLVNYTFTIVVTETGTAEKYSDNAIVHLTLINDNDNKPIFANSSYYYTFDEEVPRGKEIAVITATDGDSGSFGQITYELREQSSFFTVDPNTGNITAAKTLDYEEAKSYQFYLIANDGGGISKKEDTAIINVTLRDVNDNDPVFTGTPYKHKMSENLAPGVIVLQVTVSDKDSGENGRVTLNITSGNTDNAFAINQTGYITTTKPLDRETIPSYTLTIIASDHGTPIRSVATTVTVDVQDVNDNTPYISRGSYIVTNISEAAGGGTVLFESLEVIDKDAGDNGRLTYSMSGGDGRFILNGETGKLQTSPTGLDRETKNSYDLVINVTDRGSPPRKNSITVHVDILDINDNPPVFDPKPSQSPESYIVTLNEGPSTLNSIIIQLNASDQDAGLNGTIIYSLTGDEHNFFRLDNTTGKLSVIKELDRESPQMTLDANSNGRFFLEVTATDQAEPESARKSAVVRVTINVKDDNDNSPTFEKQHYKTHVSEAARSGSNVIQVSADDKDFDVAGKVIYNITNGDPNGMFDISESGDIFIKKLLDAEKVSLYNLTVLAQDQGNPPLSSTTEVEIIVDDVNDNDPKFNQSTYTASVMENVENGTSVVTVYATDKDKGSNGNITFKISNGNQNNAFKINDITGVISTNGMIDREDIQSYILTIQAEDQGQPSSRKDFSEVRIKVEDVNDNSPQFTENKFSAEVKENSPPGTKLILTKEIRATDKDLDSNAKITYSLSGLGADNFYINASTGILTTSNSSSLDRERNASYSLVVMAIDGGNRNTTIPLEITIKDENDEPPRFADQIYYANVSEDASQGTTITKVTATDLDTGLNAQIIYTSNGADAKFSVSRSQGNIIVDSSLDREFKSFYILNITAANIVGNVADGHTQVYITVTDVIDDKPYFNTSTITVSLPEDASIGMKVTRVTALDKDVNDILSYAIVDGDAYGQFSIDNITGDIVTTNELNRENRTQHILSVQAKDSIGLVSEKVKVVIDVTDVNDNTPVFSPGEYVVYYREQSPKDTSILKVTATDTDLGRNAQIRYSIVENVSSQISIDPETGLITQGVTELDRELQPFFNFTINATDQGVPPRSSYAKVSVILVDINDHNPEFTNETFHASVKENQPIGTSVFVATATDDDIGSNAEIEYGLSGSFKFQINRTTGIITTRDNLDREEAGGLSYTLTLRAVDGAIRSREGSARLIVTILDVNDHAPVFGKGSYAFDVKENVPIGHSIGEVSTTDKDINDNARVSYFIAAGNEMNIFAVNETTGKITTLSSLDRETNGNFTLTITAEDHGEPPKETNTTVTITINDINDNKPIFRYRVYNATLRESAPSGTKVTQVSAYDPDIGPNGVFTFKIESGDDERLFTINEQSGIITLQGKLDHETKPLINLTITAKDRGNPAQTGYSFVIVKVTDVDDNAPQFGKLKYEAQVYENITLGSIVAQVNATDIDADEAHKTIHYKIESGNTGDVFAIGDLNGTISLKCGSSGCLDRETKDRYELTVAAISIVNGTEQKSTVPLVITVLDVNDYTPTFVPSSLYSKAVPEDTEDINNIEILTVTAEDNDLGVNSEVIYSIVKGNEKGYFALDNTTGILSKAKKLDRESIPFFELVVMATDSGVPPLSSNATVRITVKDINDNIPSFEATPDTFRVTENTTIGTLITRVNATDEDEGTNAYIEYIIISGNDEDTFVLNKTSGELKTNKELDYETTPSYKLVINAKNNLLSSTKTITILVTDLNDNRPLFSKPSATLSVEENMPSGSIVGKIEAIDNDKSDPVYYYIYGKSGRDYFNLNETNGIVTTKMVLDREKTPSFSLLVKASNEKLNSSSLLQQRKRRSVDPSNTTNVPLPADPTIQRVVVEIGDINDNKPIFTKKVYTGGVPDDINHGDNVIRVSANDADVGDNGRITYGFLTTNEDSNKFAVNNETGWITAIDSFARQRGKEFILNISARDNYGQNPLSFDATIVKIYVLVIYEQAVLVSGRSPDDVRANKENFIKVLQNITGLIINIDNINFLKENGKYDYSKTAVLFHAIDPKTNKITNRDEVIRLIDENYQKAERNRVFFNEWKIKEIKPVVTEGKSADFPVVLAAAIGLGILLLIIIIIFICIVCLLRKRQKRKLRAAKAESYGGSTVVSRRSSLSLPNTNKYGTTGSNPMWVDPYQNWGATDDDEKSDLQTFKATNGGVGMHYGDIIIKPATSTNPLFESQDPYMNMNNESDESPDYDLSNGYHVPLSRKSSDERTPSPEAYESSPSSQRNFYSRDSKYQVTSI